VNRKQRRKAAKLGTQAAVPTAPGGALGPPPGIAELLAVAQRHHQAGRLAEAETAYRKVLAIDPTNFDSLHLLGVIAQQVGRSDLAVELIGKAIALDERKPTLQATMGRVFDTPGRGEDPAARRKRAAAHGNFSIALMAAGDHARALDAIQRSLQLDETENTKLLFVQCVRSLDAVPDGSAFRDNLARALSEPWGRPIDLARLAAALLKRDGATAAAIRRVDSAWPRRLPPQDLFGPGEFAAICGDRLLHALLQATPIFDLALERFLTAARQSMLEAAGGRLDPQQVTDDRVRFSCALAQQCFINEYVFACTDREEAEANALRARLADALASGAPIAEPLLVAVAAFFPLASLPAADLLLQRRWSAPVVELVDCHIREPREERQLQAAMPRLTPIDDSVSLAVKQQYEESPYPRWMKPSPVGKPTTIDGYLRQKFPLVDLGGVATTNRADILIAGCGTGRHSIETARRFAGARLLAIDLSLSSLCYAKRKTRALGLSNIEYAQADILQLPSLGRTFDVIEASGVLHHLADPMAGWRRLLAMLRPGGFMLVGLYSKLARGDLDAARRFIVRRGYGPAAADIRRCRAELTGPDTGADPAVAKVAEWGDFFSTSACRDLLFHVAEQQMTLPEIDGFLRDHHLQFLGFDLPGDVLQAFRRRFPQDGAMSDLALWHTFEMENPSIFTGMYQFWIRKA